MVELESHRTTFKHINAYSIGINMPLRGTRKRVKRTNLARGTTGKRRGRSIIVGRKPTVSPPLRRAIKAVAASQLETKYVAENTVPATPLLNTVTTPANFFRLLPAVAQGDSDSQRVGLAIDPVYAKTTFTYFFNGTSSAASWTQDKIVNLVIVKAKGHDSQSGQASIPPGEFLRIGNSQYQDPVYPVGGGEVDMMTYVNHYPVNLNSYEVLAHHTFRLRKGTGNQNSAPSATLGEIAPTGVPASEDVHKVTFKWNPPKLRYSGNLATFPNSHYPVALTWMTNADASPAAAVIVNVAAWTQLYFKDA